MEGIPLALIAERSPMLELLVIGNLECIISQNKVSLKIRFESYKSVIKSFKNILVF